MTVFNIKRKSQNWSYQSSLCLICARRSPDTAPSQLVFSSLIKLPPLLCCAAPPPALRAVLGTTVWKGLKIMRDCPKKGYGDGEGSEGNACEAPGVAQRRAEELRGGLMAAAAPQGAEGSAELCSV